jgi:hypothetical protein
MSFKRLISEVSLEIKGMVLLEVWMLTGLPLLRRQLRLMGECTDGLYGLCDQDLFLSLSSVCL